MIRKYGTHRTVYLVGSWAIKRPVFVEWRLFLHGLLANMQERQFGAMKWPELCPVIFGMPGGWFLIMQRAKPLSRSEYWMLDFDAFINHKDYVVPVENKWDSFGKLGESESSPWTTDHKNENHHNFSNRSR